MSRIGCLVKMCVLTKLFQNYLELDAGSGVGQGTHSEHLAVYFTKEVIWRFQKAIAYETGHRWSLFMISSTIPFCIVIKIILQAGYGPHCPTFDISSCEGSSLWDRNDGRCGLSANLDSFLRIRYLSTHILFSFLEDRSGGQMKNY